MSRRQPILQPGLALATIALLGIACQSKGPGGITARIVFDDDPTTSRRSLLAAAVPENVGRLEIRALDTMGSTLATTVLALNPGPSEDQLAREGGTWTLEGVPAGTNRSVLGRGLVTATGVLAYEGRIDNITVSPGTVSNVGTLLLELLPNAPRNLDFMPPSAPTFERATSADGGEGIIVEFRAPPQSDTGGYVVAVGTNPAAPTIDRGTRVFPGQSLDTDMTIHTVVSEVPAQPILLGGLQNNVTYTVALYAYDTDANGQPLNFSEPISASPRVRDQVDPGRPGALTVLREPGGGGARIRFIAPGEDNDSGVVARYEVRASARQADLELPLSFGNLPPVPAPTPVEAGTMVDFVVTETALGTSVASPFYVGVRGVDASDNEGPIETAAAQDTDPTPPRLDPLSPAIVVTESTVELRGQALGAITGSVIISATETSTQVTTPVIESWTPERVRFTVPAEARTGVLQITRSDGAMVEQDLSVLTVQDNSLPATLPPFELIGTAAADAPAIAALYREGGTFSFIAEILRIYGEAPEDIVHAGGFLVQHSRAIAGTYSLEYDRFFFVGQGATTDLMTTAHVTSDRNTPDAGRLEEGVRAGGADGVGVVLLAGGIGGALPAMIALTSNGTLRTAQVGDARTEAFETFTNVSSSTSQYTGATLARRADSALLIGHRTVTESRSELTLRENRTGTGPAAFTVLTGSAPLMAERVHVLSAASTVGAPDDAFYVVYEHQPADAPIQIRILAAQDYGRTPGYAPFNQSGLRLADAGLVIHRDRIGIAIAATSEAGNPSLYYTEVLVSDLQRPFPPDGSHPGILANMLPPGAEARIGCKPFPQRACPMALLSSGVQRLFLRQ